MNLPFLTEGASYRVIRDFIDYDGRTHPAGETWIFRGSAFLPHEDGLTLSIAPGDSIRLQWRPESQGGVIENIDSYLRRV